MSMIRNSGLTAIAAAAAFGYTPGSSAQNTGSFSASTDAELEPRYQLEVIVFAHENFDPTEEMLDASHLTHPPLQHAAPAPQKYLDALMRLEILRQVAAPVNAAGSPRADMRPFPENLLALESFPPNGAAALDFRLLEPAEYQLDSAFSRINRLSAYKALAHGGWAQEADDEEHAVPFDIANLAALGVRGTIRLHVSRFLHVTVDLTYRPVDGLPARFPVDIPFSFDSSPGALSEIELGPSYNLRAERRILRGELNYLDHPAFGLVILITLEPEPELPASEAGDLSGPAA